MEISRVRALRGPNLWSRHTSIEAVVRCTHDEQNIALLPGFEERLRARFPEIELLDTARQPLTDVTGVYSPVFGWGIVDAAAAVATPVTAAPTSTDGSTKGGGKGGQGGGKGGKSRG